jgi:hypothetical protein
LSFNTVFSQYSAPISGIEGTVLVVR